MVAEFGIENECEGPLIDDSSPDRLWVMRVGQPLPSFFPVSLISWVHTSFSVLIVQALPRPNSPLRAQRISVVAVLTRRQRVCVRSSPSKSRISPKSVETANFGYILQVSVAVGISPVGVTSTQKSLFYGLHRRGCPSRLLVHTLIASRNRVRYFHSSPSFPRLRHRPGD